MCCRTFVLLMGENIWYAHNSYATVSYKNKGHHVRSVIFGANIIILSGDGDFTIAKPFLGQCHN